MSPHGVATQKSSTVGKKALYDGLKPQSPYYLLD